MANPPEEISLYIDWQFELTAPEEKTKFFDAVKEYQAEVDTEMPWYMTIYQKIIRTSLDKKIGSSQMTIVYEYSTESPSGEWIENEEEIVIENKSGVTAGDILYSLHHLTKGRLKNQDIMAIEGLYIDDEKDHNNYYVVFGS